MRIESNRRRFPAVREGHIGHTAHDNAVPDVYAIEIADGDGAQTGFGWRPRGHGSYLDLQAIVGQSHVRREALFGDGVRQVVTDVSEPRALRTQLLYGLERSGDGGMRRMGTMAQRIEEEHAQVLEARHGLGRNIAMVGEIGRVAEAEAVYHAGAVREPEGQEFESKQIEGRGFEDIHFEVRPGRFGFALVKDVAERPADIGDGFGRTVDGDDAALPEVEGAYVVESHDVIGVRVRAEDGVNALDAGAQGLIAEIGRGVDEDVAAAVADEDG